MRFQVDGSKEKTGEQVRLVTHADNSLEAEKQASSYGISIITVAEVDEIEAASLEQQAASVPEVEIKKSPFSPSFFIIALISIVALAGIAVAVYGMISGF